MLIDIYMKFREDSLNGFQVIEWTRFYDRQTDGQTDRRPGVGNNMSTLKREDKNKMAVYRIEVHV